MTTYTRLWRRRFYADLRRPDVVRETASTLGELVVIFGVFVVLCMVWPGFLDEPGVILTAAGMMLAGIAAGALKLVLAIRARS